MISLLPPGWDRVGTLYRIDGVWITCGPSAGIGYEFANKISIQTAAQGIDIEGFRIIRVKKNIAQLKDKSRDQLFVCAHEFIRGHKVVGVQRDTWYIDDQ